MDKNLLHSSLEVRAGQLNQLIQLLKQHEPLANARCENLNPYSSVETMIAGYNEFTDRANAIMFHFVWNCNIIEPSDVINFANMSFAERHKFVIGLITNVSRDVFALEAEDRVTKLIDAISFESVNAPVLASVRKQLLQSFGEGYAVQIQKKENCVEVNIAYPDKSVQVVTVDA